MEEKFIILDVETANDIPDTMVYDLGLIVADRNKNVYERKGFVIKDIFTDEKDLMKECYYKDKLPLYDERLKSKELKEVTLFTARREIAKLINKYNIKTVYAYNASFDRNALNTTQRFLTKSKYRWFLPYGVKFNCIWHMACQTICQKIDYIYFCIKNECVSPKGFMSTNAKTVYKYLTKNADFEEEHTGLADVMIELEILAETLKYHEKVNQYIYRGCYHLPQKKFKKLAEKVLTNS